jgi:hypothetical protein
MLCAVQPSLVLKNESGKEKKINMCFCMSSRNRLYVSACRKKKKMCMITGDGSLLVICRINSQHMLGYTMKRE